jgi:hypothetical protein
VLRTAFGGHRGTDAAAQVAPHGWMLGRAGVAHDLRKFQLHATACDNLKLQ